MLGFVVANKSSIAATRFPVVTESATVEIRDDDVSMKAVQGAGRRHNTEIWLAVLRESRSRLNLWLFTVQSTSHPASSNHSSNSAGFV
jgi:hypothetical protein